MLLRYFDLALLVVAAPILLLIGVSPTGYGIGAGAWVALRVVGVAVEGYARQVSEPPRAIGVRLGYMLGRLFALAIAVILVRKADGQGAGLTCLAVVVGAFTVQLAISAISRPRPPRAGKSPVRATEGPPRATEGPARADHSPRPR